MAEKTCGNCGWAIDKNTATAATPKFKVRCIATPEDIVKHHLRPACRHWKKESAA